MYRTNRQRPRTLPIGTISEATLRPEDLISALLPELQALHLSKADRTKVRELAREFDKDPDDSEGWIWEDLTDLADRYCPPFTYFGSTEGDGACIGVWPSVESAIEACKDGEIWAEHDRTVPVKGTLWQTERAPGYAKFHGDQPERDTWRSAVPRGELFVTFSDHGNISLYQSLGAGRSREIWGVV